MSLGRIFFTTDFIFLEVNESDKKTDDDKMSHNPEIFPERVYALECKRVENESQNQGNR
jgi:hypothetical protein